MRRVRIAAALAWGALFSACGDGRLSGGYDDVENPAILVALTDAGGHSPAAGTLSLYARYQNPFQDSLPLLELAGAGDSLRLVDTVVRSAFAKAQSRGIPSPGKDTLEFNLIATASGGETFLGGFALIRRTEGWGFIRRNAGGVSYPDAKGMLWTRAGLSAPVRGQKGNIGPRGLELGLKRVFVPGSAYGAVLDAEGGFAFQRIAAGRFDLKAISADDKVYSSADTLETGTDFAGSDWSEAEVIWIIP